jgi:hypothetical protein
VNGLTLSPDEKKILTEIYYSCRVQTKEAITAMQLISVIEEVVTPIFNQIEQSFKELWYNIGMKVTVQDLINLLSEMDPNWYVQVPSEECQDADGNQLYYWQDLTSEEVYSVDRVNRVRIGAIIGTSL